METRARYAVLRRLPLTWWAGVPWLKGGGGGGVGRGREEKAFYRIRYRKYDRVFLCICKIRN